MKSSPNRTLLISLLALAVVSGTFFIVLSKTGFLSFTGSEPSSNVVAAAISLVGTFIGTMVTAFGLLIQHSLNIQAEKRLTLEAERNAALQQEAENRLSLEAAIQAVQLLATSSGEPTPPIQRAGVLFSLASLRQHELTLSLVFQLLNDKDGIEADTAGEIINQVLQYGNQEIRDSTISTLLDYSDKLLTDSGAALPQIILNDTSSFTPYARSWIPIILARTLAARPLNEWNKMQPKANAIIAALCLAWINESDTTNKKDIGVILSRIFRAFPIPGLLYHPQKTIDIDQIRSEVQSRSYSNVTTVAEQTINQLDQWIENASPSHVADDASGATTSA